MKRVGGGIALDGAGRGPASSPERRLWCAVIIQAIVDAHQTAKVNGAELHRRRARHWAAMMGTDFRVVCDLAEVEPESIRNGVLFGEEKLRYAMKQKGNFSVDDARRGGSQNAQKVHV